MYSLNRRIINIVKESIYKSLISSTGGRAV